MPCAPRARSVWTARPTAVAVLAAALLLVAPGSLGTSLGTSSASAAIIGDCVPGASWGASRPDFAQEVVALTNQHRAGLGIAQLKVSPTLTSSAVWKARHMAWLGYMTHDDPAPPVARSWADRIQTCQYKGGAGENIAYGYGTPSAVFQAWLNSTPHRQAIENTLWKAIGVGAATSSNGTMYWAQNFGTIHDSGGAPPPPPPGNSYRSTVLSHAPVAYWRLGETSGGTALDESGYARNASYVNGVALGAGGALVGDANTASSLDGANDRVAAPNLTRTGPFTLEAWAYLRGSGTTGATEYATLLGYDAAHRILWRVGDGKLLTQFDGNFFSTTSASRNAWHHLVYTFDGGTERFFIDGLAAGSHGTAKPVWNQSFRIGDYDGTNYLLNGVVDEVAVYGRALTQTEVQAHRNASGRSYGNYRATVLSHTPRAYWRFGQASGTSATDESGTARHATYVNGVTLGAAGAILGEANTAVSLDGVNDRITAPSAAISSGPFTLETWAVLRGPGSTGDTGFGSLFAYDASHRVLWRPSDGRLLAQFHGNFFSTASASLNTWHHLVYSFDGSTERFFIDGTAAGSHATTRPVWNQPFRIGDYDGSNYLFRGSLDEVAVYGRALPLAEVQAHYRASGR